jgi:hypothetical protein
MRTREQKIFSYAELTGKAKDRARDWIVEGIWDFTLEDLRERFKEMLKEAGLPNATDIYFSLGHVQGDGVTFDAKHPDLQTWLDAQGLKSKFKRLYDEDSLNIYVQNSGRGFNPPRVSVEATYAPDRYESKEIAALEETLQERVNDLCRSMRDEGYRIIEFRESESEVAEHAAANDYEFDEEGRPA